MEMFNPPHPGEILKDLYLTNLDLSIKEASEALKVSRSTLSDLVNGNSSISKEMALRLSKSFDTSVGYWLNLQAGYYAWTLKSSVSINLDDVEVLYKGEID